MSTNDKPECWYDGSGKYELHPEGTDAELQGFWNNAWKRTRRSIWNTTRNFILDAGNTRANVGRSCSMVDMHGGVRSCATPATVICRRTGTIGEDKPCPPS